MRTASSAAMPAKTGAEIRNARAADHSAVSSTPGARRSQKARVLASNSTIALKKLTSDLGARRRPRPRCRAGVVAIAAAVIGSSLLTSDGYSPMRERSVDRPTVTGSQGFKGAATISA